MTSKSLTERVWANIALIVALGTVLIAVVRVYAWSGYFVPVALSVLSVADRTTLLASTLLLILIALVPLLISELLFSKSFTVKSFLDPQTPPMDAVRRYAVLVGLALVLLGFSSLSVVVVVGVLMALTGGIWLGVVLVRLVKRGRAAAVATARAEVFSDNKLRAWPLFVLICGGALLGVLGQSWVPLESVRVSTADESVVGYVVGERGVFTLLLSEDKSANWVETDSILSRELCTRSSFDMWSRSILDLLSPTFLRTCPQVAG